MVINKNIYLPPGELIFHHHILIVCTYLHSHFAIDFRTETRRILVLRKLYIKRLSLYQSFRCTYLLTPCHVASIKPSVAPSRSQIFVFPILGAALQNSFTQIILLPVFQAEQWEQNFGALVFSSYGGTDMPLRIADIHTVQLLH